MSEEQKPDASKSTNKTDGQEPETIKKAPSFIGYHVREGKDGKSFFNQVGAAFPHKDGEGHTLDLDSFPKNGKVVLRTPKERLQGMKEGRDKEGPEEARSEEGRDR